MANRPAIIPNSPITTALPQHVRDRLDLWLYSELEGRVPKGAYRDFFSARTTEFFESRTFDLSPFLGSASGEYTIRALPHTVEALKGLLLKGKV